MEPYDRSSHFREYGQRFIRYHVKDDSPLAKELLSDKNRRPARSLAQDFGEYIFKPLYCRVMFYLGLLLGLWDDIQFTYDWGLYMSHNPDFHRYQRQQFPRYTKGWDRPTRKNFHQHMPADDEIYDHYV